MKAVDLQHLLDEFLAALSLLEFTITVIICFILALGTLLLVLALLRLRQKRILAAGSRGIGGVCCLAVAVIISLVALNIHTYHRFTYEKPVVKLLFTERGPQQFLVTVEYLDGAENRREEFLLAGDEWQMDARVLRWKPALQLLGLNAMYRLERLNGRYTRVADELSRPRTVYAVTQNRGLDIWSMARHYKQWLNWIDAYYGSAAYLPMADGAEYTLVINQSGLLARPANDIAGQAIQNW